jgi:hypothetical protein
MKKLLFFLFLTLTIFSWAQTAKGFGPEYNGLKLGKDSLQLFYLVKTNNVILTSLDKLGLDTDEIIIEIRRSTIKDRELIARIIEMHADKNDKMKELLNISETQPEIALFILKNAENKLSEKYSKKDLRKLLKSEAN